MESIVAQDSHTTQESTRLMNMLPTDYGALQHPPGVESQTQDLLPDLPLRRDSQAPLLRRPRMVDGLLATPKLRKRTSMRRVLHKFRPTISAQRQHSTTLAVKSPKEHDLARKNSLEYASQPDVPSPTQGQPSTPLLPVVFENAKSRPISSSDYSLPPPLQEDLSKRSTSTSTTSISERYFRFALPETNGTFKLLPAPHRRTSSTPANFESPRAAPPLPLRSSNRMTASQISLFPDARFSESHDPKSSLRDTLQTRRLSLAQTLNSPTFSSPHTPSSPTFPANIHQVCEPHSPTFSPSFQKVCTPPSPTFSPSSSNYTPQSPTFSPTSSNICTPQSPTFSPTVSKVHTPQSPTFPPTFLKVCTPQSPTFPDLDRPSVERYRHRPLPDPPAPAPEPITEPNPAPIQGQVPAAAQPRTSLLPRSRPLILPPDAAAQLSATSSQELQTPNLCPSPPQPPITKLDISAPLFTTSSLSPTLAPRRSKPQDAPQTSQTPKAEPVPVKKMQILAIPARLQRWKIKSSDGIKRIRDFGTTKRRMSKTV